MANLKSTHRKVSLPAGRHTQNLFGRHDEYIRLVENTLNVRLTTREGLLTITGGEEEVGIAEQVIQELTGILEGGGSLSSQQVRLALRHVGRQDLEGFKAVQNDLIEVSPKKRPVRPKSAGQKAYIDAIRKHDIVFGIGPAGTGKTYLAMAMAVSAHLRREANRIILTRPAVEAGERLGYLPGTLYEKIHPYLRPLYDALYDMLETDRANRLIEMGVIEIAPLAFMRGRTLNDSFIILDEAQNTTSEQMKMFLTRLGFNSKTVITGDITQVDLPHGRISGLIEVRTVLRDIEGIKFVYLREEDVVRHELVQQIIHAYEEHHTPPEGPGGASPSRRPEPARSDREAPDVG
ncbi:MAG: PhoH family protein [candidate division NC10 bacterium]|nr:PhoH family protein [candidate division NC10 bacterium]